MSELPQIEFDGADSFLKDTAFTPADIDGLVYWWTSDEGQIYPPVKQTLVDWLLAHPCDCAIYVFVWLAALLTMYAVVRAIEEIYYE